MLILPINISNSLITLANQTWPHECCALIGGQVEKGQFVAESCFALVNELHSPTEFRSEPKSLFAALKAIRSQNQTLIAVAHSHPSSRPKPSQKDWDEHYYSDSLCLIAGKTIGS
jgi:[CysO sulfur-carrier protein]-S-L-cysteine hydrolase